MKEIIALSMLVILSFTQVESKEDSKYSDLLLTKVTNIPKGPSPEDKDDMCRYYRIAPQTDAGIQLQKMGWGVMSEINLGAYNFVSFAGKFNSGTSGMCQRTQGNIGVFKGGNLTTIIYTKSKDDDLIGDLKLLEGGAIRIWSGAFLEWPIADIKLTNDGFKIADLSQLQSFCEGKTVVPYIYKDTIRQARKKLFQFGWTPKQSGDGLWTRAQALKTSGVTEIQACSGTGLAMCRFDYANKYSFLGVTTVWDGNGIVSYYSVNCNK